MNINYRRRELNDSVIESDREVLKDNILRTIEAYKYFYLKDANSNPLDKESFKVMKAIERVLNYFGDHILYHDEKEKYKLIQDKDTVDKDIDNMKKLFSNCFSLKIDMPKIWLKKCMEFYLETDDNFNYIDEYNSFAKLILASGSLSLHKDEIEKLTGKKIQLVSDRPIDERVLYHETNYRRRRVIESDSLPLKKKSELLKSISHINDYQLMVNDALLDSEYYMVDDITKEKIIKYKL